MHPLNQSVYLALNNYQESYEFYRARQENTVTLNFKAIQHCWNPPINNYKISA